MQGVLPPEELPSFFAAIEEMGARPRKSMRLRRDLPADARWSESAIVGAGIPLGAPVAWYERGRFFDLAAMAPHPSKHPWIAAGLGFIQEAGAMEVAPALGARSDDLVLDLCSAPGAKASHVGEFLGPEGWLVANEPSRDRARTLDAILARHGIGNSTVLNLEPRAIARAFPGVFDRVLVDAPCSGESLFAKRREERKDVSDKETERCALRQSAILAAARAACAPRGRIVYATCAYSRTENEDVVAAFLAEAGDFRLREERRRFPHRDGVPGGYFAVLDRDGAPEAGADDRPARAAALRDGLRALGARGLVRDGRRRWDGSPDAYAVLMDRRAPEGSAVARLKPLFPAHALEVVDLSLAEAARFLGGERRPKPPAGVVAIYRWEGEAFAAESADALHYPRNRL